MASATASASESPSQLIELAWAPSKKSKKDRKGKVTVRNCFPVPVRVALIDYDGTRRISEQALEVGGSGDVLRTLLVGGKRLCFEGSDGIVLYVRAQPADWDRDDCSEEWHLFLERNGDGRVAISSSRSWQQADGHRRFESERRGVSVRYLLEDFEQQARSATGKEDPTFHALAPHFAYGEGGVGRGIACPRDGRQGCSVVDALPAGSRGRATHFLSWAWGYALSTFVQAIREWVGQTEIDPKSTFLWVCFFCNNQFRILEEKSQEGSDNLEKSFAGRLTDIGKVVVLFDTWRSSVYLQRAWCVFETFMADKVGAELQIILPSAEARSLEAEIHSGGLGNVIRAFRDVNIEKARATRDVDERRVKDLISRTSSFERVNQVVKDRLMRWCEERFSMMMHDEVALPTAAAGAAGLVADSRDSGGSTHEELLVENARLRAALAEKDAEISSLKAEKDILEVAAASARAGLAELQSTVARLKLELPHLAEGGCRPGSGLEQQALDGELRQPAAPGPEAGKPAPSRPHSSLGEELESLMDDIVSQASGEA